MTNRADDPVEVEGTAPGESSGSFRMFRIALRHKGLMVLGVGIGLAYTPITGTVMSSVAPEERGAVAGAVATIQQLGYALGVAVTGVIYFANAATGIGHAFERQRRLRFGHGLEGNTHPLNANWSRFSNSSFVPAAPKNDRMRAGSS